MIVLPLRSDVSTDFFHRPNLPRTEVAVLYPKNTKLAMKLRVRADVSALWERVENDMKQLAIITDDLTSATDCGSQLARSGLRTLVVLGTCWTSSASQEADVVSVNTDTRDKPANEAYLIVRDAAISICDDDYVYIFKSLDSTLRGNLGVEIDAVLDTFEFDCAVVAPAFPFYGRTTVDGKHFLNGIPLTHTEFALDPNSPVKEDDLIRLFSSQSKRMVGLIELDTLRSGNAAVLKKMNAFNHQGIELMVFDAQLEEDLDRIIDAVSKTDYRVLWVGSTGLSRHISRLLNVSTSKPIRMEHPCSARQVMIISGSVSEATRRQVDVLSMVSETTMVEMNPIEIVGNEESASKEMERCCSQIAHGLDEGKDVALYVSSSRETVVFTKAKGRAIGLEETQVSMKVVEALAEVAKQTVNSHRLCGLVLTGGDTARAICSQLGGKAIELLEEVEPGIPMGRLIGTELFVVTKAGGFGTPYSLVNSLKTLQRI
jgi:D-threonate/D-erythronate kinase